MEEIAKLGIRLFEEQIVNRKRIRELSKQICSELLIAHCLSLGVIKYMYDQFLGIPGKTNAKISAQLPLLASFIQGIDLCEISIMEGLYSQAATLLKQELETIAAVNECIIEKRKNKRTPNVKHVGFGLGEEYGFLNGIGHLSDKDLFEHIFSAVPDSRMKDQRPVSIVPQFDKEYCRYFYSMHILLIFQAIQQLEQLFTDMYGYEKAEKIQQALNRIQNILMKCGVIL